MSNHNCPLNTSSHNRRRRASLMDELNLPISNSNSSSTPHKTNNNYSDDHPFGRSDDHLSRRPSRLHDHHDTTTPNSSRRPTLLQSVSMRSSFTFRRNTLGEELEGRRRSSTTRVGGGIRAGSFRRLSLQIEHNGGQGGDRREMQDASVSDYQEVFQQMKLQNPTASLGALQQKTMKRMSEIKLEKEEMDRMNLERLRELEKTSRQQQQHSNGRMTLLGSLFSHQSKVVGSDSSDHNRNMNSSGSDRDGSDRSNHHHHHQNSCTNTTTTPLKVKAPYAVDDSFRSNNSIDVANNETQPRLTVLSRATTVFSRRSSCADSSTNTTGGGGGGGGGISENPILNRRRSTMDTNPLSDGDASTDNIHGATTTTTNNGGTTVAVLRSSLIMMGEDQKGNLAPRKSVGDFTTMYGSDDDEEEEVDDSIFGAQSKMSGLFISGDEEEEEDDDEKKESNVEDIEDEEDSTGMGSTIFNNNDEEIEIIVSQLQLDDTSQTSHPNCDVSHTTETYHSAMSDSNHTTFTEASYFDDDKGSLIVGFEKQRVEKEDVSRGFAADFSAWDKR